MRSWLGTLAPGSHPPGCLPASQIFFFNNAATTEIYTLSLHDALPISSEEPADSSRWRMLVSVWRVSCAMVPGLRSRSEEHTSELQSQSNLVCRLLLEKKKHM